MSDPNYVIDDYTLRKANITRKEFDFMAAKPPEAIRALEEVALEEQDDFKPKDYLQRN